MNSPHSIRQTFFDQVSELLITEELFDLVPDMVFFIKDQQGRYVAANNALVERLGLKNKSMLIGKKADQLFSATLGNAFTQQDDLVLKTGCKINARMELHSYPNGKEGWCITYKKPIRDADNNIIGISGISQDIRSNALGDDDLTSTAKVLKHIRNNIDQPLKLPELAKIGGLSLYQLDQRIRALYKMSAGQCVTKARIDAACHLLKNTKESISNIAFDCGYSDQSAFTRKFKQTTGMTPKTYRNT